MSDLPATRRDAVITFSRHDSPRLLFWGAVAFLIARVVIGHWSWWDVAVVVGLVVAWPIIEWCIHVFLLHWRPKHVAGRTLDLRIAQKHRYHHREPWHLPIVFVPLQAYVYLPLPMLVAYVVAPTPLVTTFFLTYFLLSLHYEWCHYLAHIHWAPDIAYYQRRVKKHRLHHFQHERLWWGVSTGLGDELLGTDPDPMTVERSPTTHDLLGHQPHQ